jgi:hypothetical protein
MKKQIVFVIILMVLLIAGFSGCNDSTKSDMSTFDYNSFDYSKVEVTIGVNTVPGERVDFSLLKIIFPADVPNAAYFEGAEIFNVEFVLSGNDQDAGEHTIDSHMELAHNLSVEWTGQFEIEADKLPQELNDAVKNSKKIEWVASGTFDLMPPQHSIPIRVSFESEKFFSN